MENTVHFSAVFPFDRFDRYNVSYFQAHVYNETEGKCSAFVANIDEHRSATVHFLGKTYSIPPWSVSVLPDCKNLVFNTAKVWFIPKQKYLEFKYFVQG